MTKGPQLGDTKVGNTEMVVVHDPYLLNGKKFYSEWIYSSLKSPLPYTIHFAHFYDKFFKDQIVIYGSTVPDKSYQTLSLRKKVNLNSIGAFTYPQCNNRTHLNPDS